MKERVVSVGIDTVFAANCSYDINVFGHVSLVLMFRMGKNLRC